MTPDHRLSKINEIIAMGVIRLCSERKNSCVLNLQEIKTIDDNLNIKKGAKNHESDLRSKTGQRGK